tara:strand:+ start:1918 stop:3039 length:1122 start_codon:yes stop_codon:yes gene_type:complete
MKLYSGLGSIKKIIGILNECNATKVLIVCGKKSFTESGAKNKLENYLEGFDVKFFSDFNVNPKIDDAIKGAKFAKINKIDSIISIGGGSVIDMAKLIKAFYANIDLAKKIITSKIHISDPDIPIICVPTTAGSGSESTHFAVVYVGDKKYSLANNCLLSDYVILDGNFPLSASRYLKACNVLDAISQAIESTWSVNSTPHSQNISLKALKDCMSNYESFVNKKSSKQASQLMLEASNLAGQAINITKTTSAHAWSYGFTSKLNIPHGHAVWMTLPRIFKIHSLKGNRINDPRGEDYILRTMTRLKKILNMSQTDDPEKYFQKFLQSMEISNDINFLRGMNNKFKNELKTSVNLERMANNPIEFSQEQIDEIFN